jgi:hypothetical protein
MLAHSIQEEDEQEQEESDVVAMASESESKGFHVNIDIKCKGVDLSKHSLKDDIVAGCILEDSYNTVHEGAGNDSMLGGVTYYGAGAGAVAGTGHMLIVVEELTCT